MDTGKLLKVVEDIQQDEKVFSLQTRFQNILNAFNQNTPDPLNSEKEILKTDIEKSLLSNYVLTDFKILEGLHMESFFGERSWVELNNILDGQAHEVGKNLTEFVNKRKESIDRLTAIKKTLNVVDVVARELGENEYEIGFSLPTEYQKLSSFGEVIGDIKLFLTEIASVKETDEKDFRISYVSNGSIEIFIQAGQQLADYFGTVLEYALKIYGTIEMVHGLKKGYEKLNGGAKEAMEKILEADQKEKSEAFIGELMSELDISEHEHKTRLSVLFKKILKHFENGVSAEVKTPKIEEPKEPEETDDEETRKQLKEKKERFNRNKEINLRNKEIFKLQQNKFLGLSTGFLTSGEDTEKK